MTPAGARLDLPSPDWTGLLPGSSGAAVAVYSRLGLPWMVALPAPIAASFCTRVMYASPLGVGPFELVWEGQSFIGERVAVYRIRW